ncbi:hypothetical protein GCM10009609_09590 [Pseudonocardia aurantiaca]|uniref:Uncharacterized protein n=1 Tax=Pseudonocardia aurantiaca TaxID=75290 RepID=A0ABW4FCM7_9PSEU
MDNRYSRSTPQLYEVPLTVLPFNGNQEVLTPSLGETRWPRPRRAAQLAALFTETEQTFQGVAGG